MLAILGRPPIVETDGLTIVLDVAGAGAAEVVAAATGGGGAVVATTGVVLVVNEGGGGGWTVPGLAMGNWIGPCGLFGGV